MQKNSFIAAMLIFLIWAVWLFTQEPPPPAKAPVPKPPSPSQPESVPEPLQKSTISKKAVPQVLTTLENEFLRIEIDSRTGDLRKIILKEYKVLKDKNSPNVDLAEGSKPFGLILSEISGDDVLEGFELAEMDSSANRVTYRFQEAGVVRVERIYELPRGSYDLKAKTRITNLSTKTVLREQPILQWDVLVTEGSQRGGLFSPPPNLWQSMSLLSTNKIVNPKVKPGESREVVGELSWASLGNRYFLMAVFPEWTGVSKLRTTFSNFKGETSSSGGVLQNQLYSPQVQVSPGNTHEVQYRIFLGPKELQTLEKEGLNLNRSLNLGMFEFFALFLLKLMQFFHSFLHNWGLAIIALTILVKLVFFPLSHKSFKSMKEMQRIQPLIKELQERYKDDKEQLNVQMLKIMREHKVNPLGGCLPMVVQMPIYFALYQVFYNSIELRHAPFFLWIQDLSQRDPLFISPLLMGVAMFFQQKLSPKPPDPTQAKMMQIMPIMFAAFMLFLPSGLVIYIFCNTALSILQQWYINKTLGMNLPVKEVLAKTANET